MPMRYTKLYSVGSITAGQSYHVKDPEYPHDEIPLYDLPNPVPSDVHAFIYSPLDAHTPCVSFCESKYSYLEREAEDDPSFVKPNITFHLTIAPDDCSTLASKVPVKITAHVYLDSKDSMTILKAIGNSDLTAGNTQNTSLSPYAEPHNLNSRDQVVSMGDVRKMVRTQNAIIQGHCDGLKWKKGSEVELIAEGGPPPPLPTGAVETTGASIETIASASTTAQRRIVDAGGDTAALTSGAGDPPGRRRRLLDRLQSHTLFSGERARS